MVTFYCVNSVDMMHADMIWVRMWGLTCQRTEINGRYTLENMHNYSTTILTKQSGTLNRLFILLSTFFLLTTINLCLLRRIFAPKCHGRKYSRYGKIRLTTINSKVCQRRRDVATPGVNYEIRHSPPKKGSSPFYNYLTITKSLYNHLYK
jgi:hypothetical protein